MDSACSVPILLRQHHVFSLRNAFVFPQGHPAGASPDIVTARHELRPILNPGERIMDDAGFHESSNDRFLMPDLVSP